MRLALVAALALAACGTSQAPHPADVGPVTVDIGRALDAPTDTADDRPATVDAGDDAGRPDTGPADTGPGDTGPGDAGAPADTQADAGSDAAPPCGPEEMRCGGRCVETSTDEMNCGACGNVCPAGGAHTRPHCLPQGATSAGLCGFGCEAGWLDCDGRSENGCEVQMILDAGCRPFGG